MSEHLTDTADSFELTIQVAPADIDQLGHVNNVIYLRWVQDIAVAHWTARASEEDQKKFLWIVLRHEIDYRHPALLSDALIVRTWVGQATRLKFERHTEFIRHRDNRLLAKARTLWCAVDSVTGRPVEVGPEVRAAFSKP